MIGLYTRNPLRNSSTAVFRSQNLCRSTRSTFYGEAISKCFSDVSYFLAVRCSLLPLFFAPLSFVFIKVFFFHSLCSYFFLFIYKPLLFILVRLLPLCQNLRGFCFGRPPTV